MENHQCQVESHHLIAERKKRVDWNKGLVTGSFHGMVHRLYRFSQFWKENACNILKVGQCILIQLTSIALQWYLTWPHRGTNGTSTNVHIWSVLGSWNFVDGTATWSGPTFCMFYGSEWRGTSLALCCSKSPSMEDLNPLPLMVVFGSCMSSVWSGARPIASVLALWKHGVSRLSVIDF